MEKYEDLDRINVVAKLRSLGYKMNDKGEFPVKLTQTLDSPWIESCVDTERHCLLWLNIYFRNFAFLPFGCTLCWKTYYNPKTLKELVELYEFQQKYKDEEGALPCKCGVETRPFTGNLGGYAAFWYNSLGCGLKEARINTYKLAERIGKKLALKRGCTEMEQWTRRRWGKGSDEWDDLITMGTKMQEALLDSVVRLEGEFNFLTPLACAVDIKQRWIEHAAMHGDLTYLEYISQPMFPKLVNYVGSVHSPKDFPNRREYVEGSEDHHGLLKEQAGGTTGKEELGIIQPIS